MDLGERDAAIESLIHAPTDETVQVLRSIILDETDDDYIREQAAGTLGGIFDQIGIDPWISDEIPERFRFEFEANIGKTEQEH